MRPATRADLARLVTELGEAGEPLYLVAGTSLLAERVRPSVPRLELAGPAALKPKAEAAAAAIGVGVVWESPEDIIPLPDGFAGRTLAVDDLPAALPVLHFDPFSVVLRLIARGDEADYVAAVEYVRLGWVSLERLEALHLEVVPRFTSETLAQDPAEFRRKFRGLRQVLIRDADRARDAAHEPPVAARMT